MLIMRQHQHTSIGPAMAISTLLAVILPLGLLVGSSADASTEVSEPVVSGASAPATTGGTGEGGVVRPLA